MDRTEMKALCDELATFANETTQARMSEIILTLSENNDTMLTEFETLSSSHDELKQSNEALRNVNNKLLLKVGEVPTEPKKDPEPHHEPRKFEDLFNEKGELI